MVCLKNYIVLVFILMQVHGVQAPPGFGDVRSFADVVRRSAPKNDSPLVQAAQRAAGQQKIQDAQQKLSNVRSLQQALADKRLLETAASKAQGVSAERSKGIHLGMHQEPELSLEDRLKKARELSVSLKQTGPLRKESPFHDNILSVRPKVRPTSEDVKNAFSAWAKDDEVVQNVEFKPISTSIPRSGAVQNYEQLKNSPSGDISGDARVQENVARVKDVAQSTLQSVAQAVGEALQRGRQESQLPEAPEQQGKTQAQSGGTAFLKRIRQYIISRGSQNVSSVPVPVELTPEEQIQDSMTKARQVAFDAEQDRVNKVKQIRNSKNIVDKPLDPLRALGGGPGIKNFRNIRDVFSKFNPEDQTMSVSEARSGKPDELAVTQRLEDSLKTVIHNDKTKAQVDYNTPPQTVEDHIHNALNHVRTLEQQRVQRYDENRPKGPLESWYYDWHNIKYFRNARVGLGILSHKNQSVSETESYAVSRKPDDAAVYNSLVRAIKQKESKPEEPVKKKEAVPVPSPLSSDEQAAIDTLKSAQNDVHRLSGDMQNGRVQKALASPLGKVSGKVAQMIGWDNMVKYIALIKEISPFRNTRMMMLRTLLEKTSRVQGEKVSFGKTVLRKLLGVTQDDANQASSARMVAMRSLLGGPENNKNISLTEALTGTPDALSLAHYEKYLTSLALQKNSQAS